MRNATRSLAACLEDKAPEVRQAAADALAESARPAGCVPSLAAAMRDPNVEVRVAVITALAEMGESAADAVPRLAEAVSDPEVEVRGRQWSC